MENEPPKTDASPPPSASPSGPSSSGERLLAPSARRAVAGLYAVFVLATMAGVFASVAGEHAGMSPMIVAAGAFTAVIAASMLISWGAEAGQFLISQGAIVAIVALLQVLPEFMVEAVIAWKGQTENMLANLTGSNRLLMGLGWPLIYVTAMVANLKKHGKWLGPIHLEPEHAIEVWALIISSGYFFVILARGSLVWWDGVVLIGMYLAYMLLLARLPAEEEGKDELLAPSIALVELPKSQTIKAVAVILLLGGAAMVLVAEPFVDSMQKVALRIGISTFFFVQWVAPFLTEFPEKVTAFYWARRITMAPLALLNMVSSKVNQWTLLAGFVPIVYSLGRVVAAKEGWGSFFSHPVPIADQAMEVWLSLAMTMYGSACLLKRRFTGGNCAILFTLWFVQFVQADPQHLLVKQLGGVDLTTVDMKRITAVVFAVLTPIELLVNARTMTPRADLREIVRLLTTGKHSADVV